MSGSGSSDHARGAVKNEWWMYTMRMSIYGTELTDGDDGVFVVLLVRCGCGGGVVVGVVVGVHGKVEVSCGYGELFGLGFFSRGVNELIFSRRFIINPTVVLQQQYAPIHLMCVVSCADESFETECAACVCVVVVSLSHHL